jgi:hypothetical protein
MHRNNLTDITRQALAGVTIDVIQTSCVVVAGVGITLVLVLLTRFTCAIE